MTFGTIEDGHDSEITRDAGRRVLSWLRSMIWPLQRQAALVVIASILAFGLILQIWNYRSFFATEVRRAEEQHLVVARNLSMSLSRYMRDVAAIFAHGVNEALKEDSAAYGDDLSLLQRVNIDGLAILADGVSGPEVILRAGKQVSLPDPRVLDDLRLGTNEALGGIQVSGILKLDDGRYFVLGLPLSDETLAIGFLRTDYIKEIQKAIVFGELGHSAIFDQFGRAVAHPSSAVEQRMADASGISAVARMLNRETGVELFYSPPMDKDMIAGISFVPETGWPVMVPQPIEELSNLVNSNLARSYAVASIAAIFLGMCGWFASRKLVRPVSHFTSMSAEITNGNYNVSLPREELSSKEMWRLNEALKRMIVKVRESDAKLRESLKLEEKENRRKSEFLVIAGHELRTPLNGVIGMLSASMEVTQDENVLKYLGTAKKSADRLNGLVDDLVDFAEGSRGPDLLRPTAFDLDLEMQDFAALFEFWAHEAALDFRFQMKGPAGCRLQADSHRLYQILSNLVENAIKYTRSGWVQFEYEVIAGALDQPAWLHLAVSDTGIGVAPEDRDRIFQPFVQVEKSHARNDSGLGVGLAIASAIAAAMKGRIEYHEGDKGGSRFEVWLQVALLG